MDKPRLTYLTRFKQWHCISGKGAIGYGDTMKEAYNNWNEWRQVYQWENA